MVKAVEMWKALLLAAIVAQAQPDAVRVPLAAGLTITAAVSHPSGDAEVILMVQSVAADAYRMTFSFDGPPEMGSSQAVRRVLMNDHREARTMRNWYGASDIGYFTPNRWVRYVWVSLKLSLRK